MVVSAFSYSEEPNKAFWKLDNLELCLRKWISFLLMFKNDKNHLATFPMLKWCLVCMESHSFSVLPLWNYMQVNINTISLFSLGALSGNRRFQHMHSLLFWRLFHSKLALLQTQTERWTEIQPLSNIFKCKWRELLCIKSWCKPMYSCCWKNKLSETQHLIWVSRTVKTDCTTDVYGSTWSLGNWRSIENNYTGFHLLCNVTK